MTASAIPPAEEVTGDSARMQAEDDAARAANVPAGPHKVVQASGDRWWRRLLGWRKSTGSDVGGSLATLHQMRGHRGPWLLCDLCEGLRGREL